MSQIDNIIIQVRARLQSLGIKLWLEPYYFSGLGSMESEIDRLAEDFSHSLGITVSRCKLALTELQDGALHKLEARKEFEKTGRATFSVRRINNEEGTQNILEIKCSLSALGEHLQGIIADKLELHDANQVKCIAAGKIVDANKTLESQGIKNNQQLMVIISQLDSDAGTKEAMYDRIHKIKMDVEAIVDSNRQLFEMEDQDGNPVFLPPEENRALLMAMSYCEKARAAMKRQHYDEALILLLEADEKFTTCNSKFLETVDNYALVNLDIVWCYLCLKNVTQLPDAQRRLEICEKNFHRSYGENMNRLIALKGNACPERALIMRLHLLQGVVLFHQNRRDEAYEKLQLATSELSELKVDDRDLETLVEMGYEPFEVRLGLRAASGNIERAINFIHERRDKLKDARLRSEKERNINKNLMQNDANDKDWVNPRSVATLMDMGYARDLAVAALKSAKNSLTQALDYLQTRATELRQNMTPPKTADDTMLQQLKELGFTEEMARVALETTQNNIEKALDFLVKTFGNVEELRRTMARMAESAATATRDTAYAQAASTSAAAASLYSKAMEKAQLEIESLKAYKRFNEDLTDNESDYLDLPLLQEEQILAEYKRLLEQ